MNPVSLSQLQFAVTTVYHFFFVPLTLGLSVLVAIMETLYVRTGSEVYKRMVKFWGKLFIINFAMGVVTGIVQEFQFGMNWADYSRFVGDIFGAPLAIEALLAFFLESTFLGIWIFGWEKLSKKAHLAAIWLVAIGSNLSALWILIANSFMQSPVGFTVENGRAVMNDFGALVFNPYVWLQFPHTVLSGFTTAAFFVMGISVYHLLRRKEEGVFSRSFRLASIFGAVSILLVIFVGHSQAQRMVQVQPMKMAAAEALWESADPAPFSLFSAIDQAGGRNVVDIRIPRVLSLLSYNRLDGEVRGILDLQAEYEAKYGPGYYVPSVFMAYWTFRVMVGAGFLMFFLAAYALYWVMRKRPLGEVKFLGVFGLAMALPYLANTAGWLLTEMGRQPWVVYGYMKTADAVSPTLTAGMVLTSLIGFTLVYAVLMAADVYLLAKYAKAGPAPEVKKQHPVKEEAYWE
ncbi:cytochrome ubiquinol oxidase subunit I [Levilinea saccharolytica]|uniref:Cytochrome D ubiquinol oxidase subunit I n=1 Tax=Levilinea saccharolytica TaxID=229921 RepID=A0A0P6Y060_9CHLR|nr:cytochrome ubiquinol oxidase subunit I [Levilinea saccharolytica]KPL90696.1 cytochrome D ubiquinol oxidase subunit I [Levilinea saccharolytica]GAP18347.1 cytochrome bd-I ubiquinol oxidase subunit 1 apoprotein [Levilinea saccharolytica]